jgi:hypothetical protein
MTRPSAPAAPVPAQTPRPVAALLALSDERDLWQRLADRQARDAHAAGWDAGYEQGLRGALDAVAAQRRWAADQHGPLDELATHQQLQRARWVPKGYRGWLPPQPWRAPERRLVVVLTTRPADISEPRWADAFTRRLADAYPIACQYPGGSLALARLAKRLGLTLAPPACRACRDTGPAGYSCLACGKGWPR